MAAPPNKKKFFQDDEATHEKRIAALREQSAKRVATWGDNELPAASTYKELVALGDAKMTPASVIAPYYGDNFEKEVLEAQEANKKINFLSADSYSKLYDPVPAEADYYTSAKYKYGKRTPKVEVGAPNEEGKYFWNDDHDKEADVARAYAAKEGAARRNDEEGRKAIRFMRLNNYDPLNHGKENEASSLEHELGHHYSIRGGGGRADNLVRRGWDETSAGDTHIAKPVETRQAMGRLQREVYKNTGSRVKDEETFMAMVEKPPEYLSNEGRRLLNYAKRLHAHRMGPEELEHDKRNLKYWDKGRRSYYDPMERDETRIRSDDAVLKSIIEGLPATVKNKPAERRFFS